MTITITWAMVKTVALYIGLVLLGAVLAIGVSMYIFRNFHPFR
jgi:hypothetical protein